MLTDATGPSQGISDIAIAAEIDEIRWQFIEKNTFEGLEGIVKLSEIKKYRNQIKHT